MDRREYLAAAGVPVVLATTGCVDSTAPWSSDSSPRVESENIEELSITDFSTTGESVDVVEPTNQYGVDARNSGRVETSIPNDVSEQWISRVNTRGGHLALGSDRILHQVRDRLAILDYEGRIDAEILRSEQEGFGSEPVMSGNVAFVSLFALDDDAAGTGVEALDLAEKEIHWKYESYEPRGPLALHDGILYFAGLSDESLFFLAVDAATGEELWSQPVQEYTERSELTHRTPLAITGDAVLGCFEEPNELVSLDIDDGTINWEHEFEPTQPVIIERPVVTDEYVLVLVSGHILVALNHEGEEEWENTFRMNDESIGAVYDEDSIYVITESGVNAIDFDGEEQWTFDFGFHGRLHEPVITDDAMLISDGSKCRSISLNDPQVLWEYEPEDIEGNGTVQRGLDSSPATSAGEVYVAASGGDVISLN